MNIEKQIDLLKKKRDSLHNRFIDPINLEIEKLEKVKKDLSDQIEMDYTTIERQEQLDRILNFKSDEGC